ncbi:MAG TPA: hypothetical protein P5528_09590 [Steroidobacteraceae bacterium]|nr:hypothetical protein [Steroidobacteraceae bacterium]HRX89685.1 hypothetical protein [Steroidobacteraceae bacterium]
MPQTLGRAEILRLIPHQGSMCLLDDVRAWHADWLLASTMTHRMTLHPLASGGRLRAIHLCEYGAQAMAIHGGLLGLASDTPARAGLLVSLRGVQLHCDYLETLPAALEVRAERLLVQRDSWQYQFQVEHAGHMLASGRAAVIAQDFS